MKKLITIGTVSVVFISACLGGVLPLSKPQLSEPPDGYDGLASNAISTIRPQGDSTLWLATGTGLSRTDDFGSRFHSYYSGVDSLPHGGISSIAVQDSVIWVAAVFDSSTITGEQRYRSICLHRLLGRGTAPQRRFRRQLAAHTITLG